MTVIHEVYCITECKKVKKNQTFVRVLSYITVGENILEYDVISKIFSKWTSSDGNRIWIFLFADVTKNNGY